MFYKAKIDLHCHSSASSTPGSWLLKQIGCPESYTSPEEVYELAMSHDMDFVTITDHDVIHGVKEISHYSNVIVGTEVTTYFPDRVKVHVVCLDISEQQHKEINQLRENIYVLVDYLSKEDIIHFVAHPLYKVDNGNLTLEHFEKLILLFKRHEVLNAGRYERTNRVARQALSSLTQNDIERLANKHGLEPVGEEPWEKYFVGGSDDHGGLFVGSCYTEVLVDEMTKSALLDGIRNGRTSAYGKTDGSLTLAHQMISIAYQYVLEKFDGESSKEELMLKWIFSRNGKKDYYAKQFEKEIKRTARKKFFSLTLNSDKKDQFNLIEEMRSVIEEKPELKNLFRDKLTDEEFNTHLFTLATELLDRLVVKVVEDPSIFKTLMVFGPAVLSAYMISMASVHQDNDLLQQVESVAGIQKPKKVAWFTDRYHGVDGVVMTIKKFLAASFEYDCDLTVVISDDKTEHPQGVKSFPAITDFQLPMYSNIVGQLYVPSFLRVARWMEEEEFDSVVISTPGPMGFAGMIAGKILGLPITAIYHTDLPRYSYELTGDSMFANVVRKLTKAFYNQANRILVPSKHYAEELMSWGIYADKIDFMRRWVDRELFSPKKKNGYFGYDEKTKLLYVGRISKEKNLDLLLKAHSELSSCMEDFAIYCVGDGPYLEQLKQKTAELRNFEFMGPIFGEELAEVYASADLFVFPSLTDSFGNVVLEAQASGVPCIVMNQGGPKEIVDDGKSGIVAEDEGSFIDAIENLILDDESRNEMSKYAVTNAYRFDKEKIFMKFWQEV